MIRIALLMILGTCAFCQNKTPYPNELPQYRFYTKAKWRGLIPSISTIADVRRLLGTSDNDTDLANAAGTYSGDDHVSDAVLSYSRVMRGWDLLIYLRKSCGLAGADIPRLCSVDLLPRKRVSFAMTEFPSTFRKKHVIAADAAWDEYTDGSGLRYEVYTTKTPYGRDIPGDLNRISYGKP